MLKGGHFEKEMEKHPFLIVRLIPDDIFMENFLKNGYKKNNYPNLFWGREGIFFEKLELRTYEPDPYAN